MAIKTQFNDLLNKAKSSVENWPFDRSKRRQKRAERDKENEEKRKQKQDDWKEVSKAYLKSKGLENIQDIDKNQDVDNRFFLADGPQDLLKEGQDAAEASRQPCKWLVLADSDKGKSPPANLPTLLAEHNADGFVWISTAPSRVSLYRKYRRVGRDTPATPYALYSLKDVDRCVDMGRDAGGTYKRQFRKERSIDDYFNDAIGMSLSLLGIYVAIVVAVHVSWSGGVLRALLIGYAILAGIGIFFWLRVGYQELARRVGPVLLLLVTVPVAAIWFAGTYNWARDTTIAVIFGFLLFGFAKYQSDKRESLTQFLNLPDRSSKDSLANRRRLIYMSLWLCLTWVSLSVADRWFGNGWWFEQPLRLAPERFEKFQNRVAASGLGGRSDGVAIGLSGGGYRAAVLHSGVLHAVEDLALPVSAIGTISGGSIVGSFYALGGRPTDFVDAVKVGRFNLKRDLLNVWELPRMTCPGTDPIFSMEFFFFCDAYGRSNVQAKLLDRILLGEAKLSELPSNSKESGAPLLIMGAVDLRTGELLGFTSDALLRMPQSGSSGKLATGRLPRLPGNATRESLGSLREKAVSVFVAGSGAFPGAINSIVLERREDGAKTTTFNIADGGLADNYGLSLLLAANEHHPEWELEFIMVSDGSMPLAMVDNVSGFTEFFRGMDVVYASSGLDDFDGGGESPEVLRLSPTNLEPRFSPEGKLEQLAALSQERLEKLWTRLPDSLRNDRGLKSADDLRNDIERSVATFFQVSTLQDQFRMSLWAYLGSVWGELDKGVYHGEAQVDGLFALGQYLVYYHCAEIAEGIGLKSQAFCQKTAN